MKLKENNKSAFIKEYIALCEKHGLFIAADGEYDTMNINDWKDTSNYEWVKDKFNSLSEYLESYFS